MFQLMTSISIPDADGLGLSGVVPVTVTSEPPKNLSRIELYVGNKLLGSHPTAPHVFQWDTTTVPDGTHILRAEAIYKTRRSKAQIAVTVTQEPPPPPPPPPPPDGNVFEVPATIDNSGATDVTAALQAWINSVPNGTAAAPKFCASHPACIR